jgi:ABC-2 type transport system permease protein
MIFTIAAKELRSLFGSPLAWIILAVLNTVIAYIFLSQIDAFNAIQPQLAQLANAPGITEIIVAPLFGSVVTILLMVTPMLAMRLIAEERRHRTLTLLLSAPISMTEIVLGKFLGLFLFLCAINLLTLLMSLSLYAGGKLDLGLVAANLAGILLIAASFTAISLYISSLTSHPVIAAIGGLGALLGLWVIGMAGNEPNNALSQLSLIKHFESFNKGLIDTGDVIFFLLFTTLFLVLAIRRLDQDRLRG